MSQTGNSRLTQNEDPATQGEAISSSTSYPVQLYPMSWSTTRPPPPESSLATSSFISPPHCNPDIHPRRSEMFSYLPGTNGDALMSQNPRIVQDFDVGPTNRATHDSPTDLEPRLRALGASQHAVPCEVNGPPGQICQRSFPGDNSRDQHRPTIHSSTFIGGNINHIKHQGESGESTHRAPGAC